MKFLKESKHHLHESGWTYGQHLMHSIRQSNRLMLIAVKSYLHGIFPWIWASSGPVGIYKIYSEIRRLHHVQKKFKENAQHKPFNIE